jgi:hypothetical protein
MLFMWPGFFVIAALDIESWALPASHALRSLLVTTFLVLTSICIPTILTKSCVQKDSCFNVLLLIGIALTSPLFISVGCLLTIPLSIFADWWLHDALMTIGSMMGVLCIT